MGQTAQKEERPVITKPLGALYGPLLQAAGNVAVGSRRSVVRLNLRELANPDAKDEWDRMDPDTLRSDYDWLLPCRRLALQVSIYPAEGGEELTARASLSALSMGSDDEGHPKLAARLDLFTSVIRDPDCSVVDHLFRHVRDLCEERVEVHIDQVLEQPALPFDGEDAEGEQETLPEFETGEAPAAESGAEPEQPASTTFRVGKEDLGELGDKAAKEMQLLDQARKAETGGELADALKALLPADPFADMPGPDPEPAPEAEAPALPEGQMAHDYLVKRLPELGLGLSSASLEDHRFTTTDEQADVLVTPDDVICYLREGAINGTKRSTATIDLPSAAKIAALATNAEELVRMLADPKRAGKLGQWDPHQVLAQALKRMKCEPAKGETNGQITYHAPGNLVAVLIEGDQAHLFRRRDAERQYDETNLVATVPVDVAARYASSCHQPEALVTLLGNVFGKGKGKARAAAPDGQEGGEG